MSKLNFWNEGESVLLRGVYDGHPVYMQSARVIKDSPKETALLVCPGAECMVPNGYIHHSHDPSKWDRWQETLTNSIQLEKFIWHTNRFLILLEPEKFYSTIYIWETVSDRFVCYYINFQLPFRRTRLGFDSLDLDLDIVIESSHEWQWKDMDEYHYGVDKGGIRTDWVKSIEKAQEEVFARIEKRAYPLDASWLYWRPDPNWSAPKLPENWNEV